MVKKALVGAWVTCVCLTVSAGAGYGAVADIVLYASDATNLRGNWSRIADASGAGGQVLSSADKGWSNTTAPAASPADSVDFSFSAPSATAYHVWFRMRAAANSKFNDSMYVQFSDAVDASGAAIDAIGTANGINVNLAGDSAGTGLSGWGWQDGAYWLTQTTTVRFASNGAHTLRIQTREDGVQIDQVVLSAVTFLTSAPGPIANDTTIVPKAASVTVPTPWTAQDIGVTGVPGTAGYTDGTFAVGGGGSDIWGTADAFRLVSRPVTGDTRIIARVAALQNTNTFAKAGIMLRQSAAADAAHIVLDVRPNGSSNS